MALQEGFADTNFHLCDCGSGLFTPDSGKYQIARVKFGVPLDQVCKNDIPGPLLVLILKLNKQAPYKKDIFRAPGHHGNVKKLIHFLQSGRLVNIDNFSVYTIASVIKKFLRKIPDGIFGKSGEQQLFKMLEMESVDERREHIYSIVSSLPVTTQRLIVLLFGTFRIVAMNAERSETGMTAEALGVSVAPSFFQSCVADGATAKMEDVLRYKVATKITEFLIKHFGSSNIFGRENYEYYARITGRILKVDEDWIVNFPNSADGFSCPMTQHEDSHSTPELMRASTDTEGIEDFDSSEPSASLTIIPENHLGNYTTRLSISLEDTEVIKDTFDESNQSQWSNSPDLTLEVKPLFFTERTKSLMILPQVYERQVARMKTRSDWFLSPSTSTKSPFVDVDVSSSTNQIFGTPRDEQASRQPGGLFNMKPDSLKQLVRRGSFEEKQRRLLRRTSSKKKSRENGSTKPITATSSSPTATWGTPISPVTTNSDTITTVTTADALSGVIYGDEDEHLPSSIPVAEPLYQECSSNDIPPSLQVSLTYKPRI